MKKEVHPVVAVLVILTVLMLIVFFSLIIKNKGKSNKKVAKTEIMNHPKVTHLFF